MNKVLLPNLASYISDRRTSKIVKKIIFSYEKKIIILFLKKYSKTNFELAINLYE